MSANGSFSSTLDYTFFGGGVVQVSGEIPTYDFPLSLVSTATLPIYASSTNNLDFIFTGGVENPANNGQVNATFGFTGSATVEIGISRFAKSEWSNRFEFTANAEGLVVVSATFDNVLPFTTETNIYVFSEGPASGTFDFSVAALGTNVSTHAYSRTGGNAVKIGDVEFNGVRIPAATNGLRVINNGITHAEVINN